MCSSSSSSRRWERVHSNAGLAASMCASTQTSADFPMLMGPQTHSVFNRRCGLSLRLYFREGDSLNRSLFSLRMVGVRLSVALQLSTASLLCWLLAVAPAAGCPPMKQKS